VKNINSTHRVEGIDTQFGLKAALAASKLKQAGKKVGDVASGLEATVKGALRPNENA
jgi:hypothetical protein